jgi:hypothetical protein
MRDKHLSRHNVYVPKTHPDGVDHSVDVHTSPFLSFSAARMSSTVSVLGPTPAPLDESMGVVSKGSSLAI